MCVSASRSLSAYVRAGVHVSVINPNNGPFSCSGASSLTTKLETKVLIKPKNLPPYLH